MYNIFITIKKTILASLLKRRIYSITEILSNNFLLSEKLYTFAAILLYRKTKWENYLYIKFL